jgi:hypothetical protein
MSIDVIQIDEMESSFECTAVTYCENDNRQNGVRTTDGSLLPV